MSFETRLKLARLGMVFLCLLGLVLLITSIAGGSLRPSTVVASIALLVISVWWFHIWGVRGNAPTGAANRLPRARK